MKSDILIIGTGQAGVPLAARLSEAGRSVTIFERKHLGGTCVNYGCTPTKTMIASAHAAHVARTAGELGVRVDGVTVDLDAVVDRKDAMVREWRSGVEEKLAGAERVRVVREHARFSGPRAVEAGGESYEGGVVIINTGARPVVPDVPGLGDVEWLDNTSIMELRELPARLLVMGGGYIGCELGQAFRRFGTDVTILDRNDHLMSREDPEISDALEDAFREEGIELRLGVGVARVERAGSGVALVLDGGERLEGSHLLVATGRRPNTDDLRCDVAGVDLTDRGAIRIDDRYRTDVPGVYAVGDVTGGPQFTHTSWDDHRILFDLLMAGEGAGGDDSGDGATTLRTRADRLVPYAAFTDPQVARVGLSERDAREQGIEYEVAEKPFGHVARSRETGRTAGHMKVLLDPATERVLGAAIVGAEAGELIHIFAVIMQAGATARALVDVEAIHPTFAEGVQSLVMGLERYAL